MAQGYNDKLDESLGMKDGPEDTKDQSMKDRRDESRGERKSLKSGGIDALISHLEEGLAALKEHKASMDATDTLTEEAATEVLPGGDILAEAGASDTITTPGGEDVSALIEAEMVEPAPGPMDLDALTAMAAKKALA